MSGGPRNRIPISVGLARRGKYVGRGSQCSRVFNRPGASRGGGELSMDAMISGLRNPPWADLARVLRRWLGASPARHVRFSEADRAVITAQGKTLMLLATMLHARGVMDMEEFAGTLGVFSVVVAEDNAAEGDILAVWAGLMKDGR